MIFMSFEWQRLILKSSCIDSLDSPLSGITLVLWFLGQF